MANKNHGGGLTFPAIGRISSKSKRTEIEMFALARNYGPYPALNVLSGWFAWKVFCESVVEGRNVAVVSVTDCVMRCEYNHTTKEFVFPSLTMRLV